MKIVIYDLEPEKIGKMNFTEGEFELVSAADKALYCQGCFHCWVKTPGECSYKDRLQKIGSRLAQCEEVVLLSRCCYGAFSPEVKRVLDRSIAVSLPFFTYRGGEIHHMLRYKNHPKMTVCFYGEITDFEKKTAQDIAERNCVNYGFQNLRLYFAEDAAGVKEVLFA